MERTYFPRWAGGIAATLVALTFGFSTAARAQNPPDFTDIGASLPNAGACAAPMDGSVWLGFCSPVWKLPMGAPEIAFGDNGVITYEEVGKVLTISAKLTAVYFDTHGNIDHLDRISPEGVDLDAARRATTSVVLRVKIGNDGKFAGGAGGACGVGSFDDFCVTGTVTNPRAGGPGAAGPTLLRGMIEQATNMPNAITHSGTLYDNFEYYINITGGDIFTQYWWGAGFTHIIVQAFGYNYPQFLSDGVTPDPRHVVYVGNNPFTHSFTENFLFGYTGVTANGVGFLFDPCNGRISGSVSDYFNALNGIPGASVELNGPSVHLILDPDDTNGGPYASVANLCVGTYQVTVHAPSGYTVYGTAPYSNTYSVPVSTAGTGNNSIVTGVNFKLYTSPVSTSAYTTFAQAAWGTRPKGQNAGMLLATYFNFLYPTGEVEIGIPDPTPGYSITETGAVAIQEFLPQEGRPMRLTADYVDPPSRLKPQHSRKYGHHRRLGSLAGEVLALELNVRFSAFSLTRNGLGSLHVATGKLAGMTVDQVLALGNNVLGGGSLPATLRYLDDLEDIIEMINKNYRAGTTDYHYLVP